MAEIQDQIQETGTNNAGFGEWAGVRYRGMGFTPSIASLTAISFDRNKGSKGIKIYLDEADTNSLPIHAVGSEIYSWEVTNASITGNYQKFTLPVEQNLTIGNRYCFYIAPWDTSTHAYADDYQDAVWKNSDVYAGGKPIVFANWSGSAWAVGDDGALDMYFSTWGNEAASTSVKDIIGMGFIPFAR